MKFLIFDTDRSLATIGGKEDILRATGGIPHLPISGGVMQIKEVLDRLWVKSIVEERHELLDIVFRDEVYTPTPAGNQLGLDGIVLDTVSFLFAQDKRILEDKSGGGQLEQRDWGKLERYYTSLFQALSGLPAWVIVNAHIKYDKDSEKGVFVWGPQVQGQTFGNLPKYFDCVFYTKTAIAPTTKERLFSWQTAPDIGKNAKDRKDLMKENFIPMDHGVVIKKYQDAGIPYPKILIIGDSGSGKTKALTTINK